ncbi:helix-turn-helix transcriptional regulator [Symbioplanes lichenis]|uniref:helix-turn-helix transcriptional regulator n=1 Tax=Symbioplanes lichenis TaxID=1629072 RepID=UPI002738E5F1|nr:LuxR family transcriptional regulator [Actinoplanes lichenis]
MVGEPDAPGLVGRGAVWAELVALLDPARPESTAAVLTGAAGIGKTALVDAFAGEAAGRDHVVLRVTGGGGGPYAGLRALFADVPAAVVDGLPDGQRRALGAALAGEEHGVDLLALRSALCAALTRLAGDRGPVVLVADDVDRVDAPTFDLLLTLAAVITWRQAPVVALFAARTERMPGDLGELVRAVPVRALADTDADRLLDRLPAAPAGADRPALLRRAAGNPLALRELSATPEVIADRGDELFDRAVRALPEATLRALTLAAAGERDLAVIARADPAADGSAWRPAEEAGLVSAAGLAVRFRHPLVEQAVLAAAGPEGRRRAHLDLAGVTVDPRQALLHRAAAAQDPDPALAAELIEAADRLDGAGAVTAIGLLEQAAALLDPEQRPAVLLRAADRASAVGRVRWAGSLLDRASAGADPQLARKIAILSAWTLVMRGHPGAAAHLFVRTLTEAGGSAADPALLAQLAGTAAFPIFLLGDGPLATAFGAAVRGLETDLRTLFPIALLDPGPRVRDAVLAVGDPKTAHEVYPAAAAGAAALLLDEPEHALRLLGPAVTAVTGGTAIGALLSAPGAAGWALIDLGRWTEADQVVTPLLAAPITAEAPLIRAGAHTQLAVIAYGRGRAVSDAELDAALRPLPGMLEVPVFAVRMRWAQGLAAAADGDHDRAYQLLREACGADGDLRHPWQLLVLPDLAAAAARVGDRATAARIIDQTRHRYATRTPTARINARLAAATALLDEDPAAAATALAPVVAGSGRWPYERAVLAVELADRLRRAQQTRRAREVLLDALETFERLGAAGWVDRVRGLLRAETSREDPFAGLTAQQVQIVRLAADGLTNREIGERLGLSPRTVGSHLYRIFPLLGVANRTQLGVMAREQT